MRDKALRSLAARLAWGVAITIVIVVADGAILVRVEPVLVLAIVMAVTLGSWLISFLPEPAQAAGWEQPMWKSRAPHFRADVRTRRLAAMLSHAQPGRAFDTSKLAALLTELTARRLVASGRTPADDPLAGAEDHLSPGLLARVRGSDRAPALTRRTLQAHLKEIDSL